ncbi:MAG: YdcF family protein [Luteimonas sp.]|nr:YdcF family protein [Luteimonas sp.]
MLVAMLAACISLRSGKRAGTVLRACVAVALVAVLAMTPLVANTLLGQLENAVPESTSCSASMPATAVVLAGGLSGRPAGPDDLSVLGLSSRRRLDRAVAWWQEDSGRHLVMSGGSWFGDGIPDASLMSRYAQQFGVPASAISMEARSLTTWESARQLAALRPALPRRVALVTSAAHMPRAVYAMEIAGFDVCTVQADRRQVPLHFPGLLVPQSSSLEKTEDALHEMVGMQYYRWRAMLDRS